MLNRCKERNF